MSPLTIRKAKERGFTDLGWLQSRHTFSFGDYFDSAQVGFSDLLVINDDRVSPGKGFGAHAHRDMEIFSYVLSGALEHKDSMGTGSVIRPGDVQLMSAGLGVQHSEFNASKTDTVHFLQIWIVPNRNGVEPQYQQAHFGEAEKRGKLRLVISSEGDDGALKIHQDAKVFAGLLDGKEQFSHQIPPNRNGYVHIARGELSLNEDVLKDGDGVCVRGAASLNFTQGKDAEVLVFELRPLELPQIRR